MKKFLLVALLASMMTGCVTVTEGVPQEEYDALLKKYEAVVAERDAPLGVEPSIETEQKKPVGAFDEEKVLSQLDVTEYSFCDGYWNYHFLVIKNNSDYTLEISANTKYYDVSGNLVGAKDDDEYAVGSGSEICLYFTPDEEYATSDYELSVKEDEWYESVVADLTYESIPAKEKEIVSVTNNGSEAAEFVEVYALFFNGDKPVDFNTEYFTDDDSELKPGKTITEEIDCYEDYTSVRFFITGRRDNW